jgi:hypothetical protein
MASPEKPTEGYTDENRSGEVNKRCASWDKIQLSANPVCDVKARAKNKGFQIFTPFVIDQAVSCSVFLRWSPD